MKKVLLAISMLALGTTAATAADLAPRYYTKAPPPVVAVYDWSGFYVGGNVGYGSGRDCRTNADTAVFLGCYDPNGVVAGGQIGYRWQYMNNWVFGLEAMGDWADIHGSTQNLVTPAN